MADRKAVIKNADMAEDMQQDAIDCATQALEKYNIEKDIAAFIKKEFDKKYNPTWHAVVGRNFGSYVTHETKHFIYFYLGQVAVLLFKSGWGSVARQPNGSGSGFWLGTNFGPGVVETYQKYEGYLHWLSPFGFLSTDDDEEKNDSGTHDRDQRKGFARRS